MARQDAMSITTDGASTKDKLAESYGKVIEAIQAGAISEQIKNTDYSGDPTSGSVEINRFANAKSQDYGTARTAGKGTALANKGKVTINVDTDKEIVEEIQSKDVRLFGIPDIIARRRKNHALRMIAELDRAYFTKLESVAEGSVTLDAKIVDIQDVAEEMIQSIATVNNEFVDGVDREMIVLTLSPAAYGKLRNYIDHVSVPTVDSGEKQVAMFHGVRVFENARQTKAIIATIFGSAGQPVLSKPYNDEKIPLSDAHAVELYYSYGTEVVTPDLVKFLDELPSPKA